MSKSYSRALIGLQPINTMTRDVIIHPAVI